MSKRMKNEPVVEDLEIKQEAPQCLPTARLEFLKIPLDIGM